MPCAGAWAAESATDEFAALVDRMWQFQLEQEPLFATSVGEHRYNDRLPAVSRTDSERRNVAQVAFLERLDQIDRVELSASDRINYDILHRQITDGLAEFAFGSHFMPITQRRGFHISFPELPRDVPLDTLTDYENYIARLRAFGDYADGHIGLMREGIAAERVLPAIALEGWSQAVDAQITDDPESSLLYVPFKEFPATIPAGEHDRLRVGVREAISTSVVPGYLNVDLSKSRGTVVTRTLEVVILMEEEALSVGLGVVVVGLDDLKVHGTSRLLAAEDRCQAED